MGGLGKALLRDSIVLAVGLVVGFALAVAIGGCDFNIQLTTQGF